MCMQTLCRVTGQILEHHRFLSREKSELRFEVRFRVSVGTHMAEEVAAMAVAKASAAAAACAAATAWAGGGVTKGGGGTDSARQVVQARQADKSCYNAHCPDLLNTAYPRPFDMRCWRANCGSSRDVTATTVPPTQVPFIIPASHLLGLAQHAAAQSAEPDADTKACAPQ